MCIDCMQQMAAEIEKQSQRMGHDVLPSAGRQVLEILAKDEDGYAFGMRFLSIFFAMFPSAFLQFGVSMMQAKAESEQGSASTDCPVTH